MAGILDVRALEGLRADLRGEVFSRVDAGYDEARSLWNGMVDRRPAAIAAGRGRRRRRAAVRFARELGLTLNARGGGHGVAGNALSDGGLVVDLSRLREVTVDPDARTARAGGGATLGDLDAATQTTRPRDSARRRDEDGNRGSHALGRHRVASPQAWALRRQPRLARGRHRGRAGAHGERDREHGALLGAPRRRWELRRRDRARVPPAPGRA